jgi:peptide/nickel transport system permease protein
MTDEPVFFGSVAPLDEDAAWDARVSRWHILAQRLRGNRQLVAGAAFLGVFVAVAVAALLRYGAALGNLPVSIPYAAGVNPPGPSWAHPFGVMNGVGIEVLPALVRATPIDLALIGGIVALAVTIGVILGSYAALVGGPADALVTGATDILVGVPPFFLVMVLFLGLQAYLLSTSYLLVFGILFAVVLWPYHARPVRARALQVAGEPYVESVRATGGTTGRILVRHVIPNSLYPVMAQIPVDVYNILFVLTVFPFLGCFGGGAAGFYQYLTILPQTVYPEWGYLLAAGACYGWSPLAAVNHWWMYTFPALVIIAFGIAVTLTCDGFDRFLSGVRRST